MSVAPVPLFLPRIAVVVVAVALPEAGFVLLQQLQSTHPFRALPEVQMWYEQARGATVLRSERLTVVLVHDPRLAAGHLVERKVRRVAAIAPGAHELPARLDGFEQPVYRHAGPRRVELRPLRHAVDVDREGLAGQRRELRPRPA